MKKNIDPNQLIHREVAAMRAGSRQRKLLIAGVILLGAGLLFRPIRGDENPQFARWEQAIAALERQDQDQPPPKNAIVFVGSSTIRLWDLKKSFPDLQVINRGFGGSQIADSAHFAPRLVTKHAPRLVVLYAGDNDIAQGKTPEQVAADFRSFVRAVYKDLPKTNVLFISVKPSVRRWNLWDKIQKANALIQADCKRDERLIYVDITKPMLGNDGQPRKDLFVAVGLHFNARGYESWAILLKPYLK